MGMGCRGVTGEICDWDHDKEGMVRNLWGMSLGGEDCKEGSAMMGIVGKWHY